MPSKRQQLVEECNRVQNRRDRNRRLLLQLQEVEITASGVELAKVRVEIERTQNQIREDDDRLDGLQAEIDALGQAGMGPQPEMQRLPFEPETVLIPNGPFAMGSADLSAPASEQLQHIVDLPDFRIGKYPVTVREFAAYVKDAKAIDWASSARESGWFNLEPPKDKLDHPVTGVSWYDAVAYCQWLSSKTGRTYVLPSEAEWEKAGSGAGKPRYPWGDAWHEGCANAASNGTTPVTAHPAGASAYGVEDLLGNVQEWTRSMWGSQPAQPDFGYPYDPSDGREVTAPESLPAQARLVHRGGSFKSTPNDLRCTARGNALPDSRIAWRGLRVVMVVGVEQV